MIFVTVGSQMPFRRLIRAVDEWALLHPSVEIVAQVGSDNAFRPAALKVFESVPPVKYAELIRTCDLIVAHAGMGSVLSALEHRKPMLLMPRRGALHETRNDHQVATLRWLQFKPGVYPAEDEEALKATLDIWLAKGLAPPPGDGEVSASLQTLVTTLRTFIG